MQEIILNSVLNWIVTDWNKLPLSYKPYGVWVCLHETMVDMKPKKFLTPIKDVWFLNDKGLYRHSIHEFVRFCVVHFDQPWCLKSIKEPISVLSRPHKIGIVEFAQCTLNQYERIFLAESWGGAIILKVDSNYSVDIEKILEV
jgi:hypothetical protein